MANIDWASIRKRHLFASGGYRFEVSVANFTKCTAAIVTLSTTVEGGSSPYTYAWSPSTGLSSTTASSPTASHTSTVTYTVVVTDSIGRTCSDQSIVTVAPALSLILNWTDVLCYNGTDGEVIANVSNGVPPYSYLWSNAATSSSISGLTAGIYSVVVTDACGSTAADSANVLQPTQLAVTINSTNNVCYAAAGGIATASVSGGTTSYSYLWSNTGTSSVISGLTAGTYTLLVTDGNGCTINGTVSITEPALYTMSVSAYSTASITPGEIAGLSASTNGIGVAPITYVWTPGGMTGGTATASPTQSTIYTVVATDYCGKTGSATASVVVSNEFYMSGGVESTVGGDTLMTFNSSGVLSVTGSGTARILVVGGGGGGNCYKVFGPNAGGGGGGGGQVIDTSIELIAGTYTITVGNGGAGTGTNNTRGTAGGLSEIVSITASNGGTNTSANGNTGNSSGNGNTSAAYTTNKGSGGSGNGSAGINSGNGGDGTNSDITGSTVMYGSGGGGGATDNGVTTPGGVGGSGAGNGNSAATTFANNDATDGTANRGGGGGGASNDSSVSKAGGSGVVVIRYVKVS